MSQRDKYFISRYPGDQFTEVTKDEYIKAERAAGFRPKGVLPYEAEYWTTCATASFNGGITSGRIEYAKTTVS